MGAKLYRIKFGEIDDSLTYPFILEPYLKSYYSNLRSPTSPDALQSPLNAPTNPN